MHAVWSLALFEMGPLPKAYFPGALESQVVCEEVVFRTLDFLPHKLGTRRRERLSAWSDRHRLILGFRSFYLLE